MARSFALDFYSSKAWKEARSAYMRSVGGLCEICLSKGIYTPAVIVHHKIHLDPETIKNPDVALAFSNLCAVCVDCHAKEHQPEKRYKIAPNGAVITN